MARTTNQDSPLNLPLEPCVWSYSLQNALQRHSYRGAYIRTLYIDGPFFYRLAPTRLHQFLEHRFSNLKRLEINGLYDWPSGCIAASTFTRELLCQPCLEEISIMKPRHILSGKSRKGECPQAQLATHPRLKKLTLENFYIDFPNKTLENLHAPRTQPSMELRLIDCDYSKLDVQSVFRYLLW